MHSLSKFGLLALVAVVGLSAQPSFAAPESPPAAADNQLAVQKPPALVPVESNVLAPRPGLPPPVADDPLLFPPSTPAPAREILSQPVPNWYNRNSPGAYDQAGTQPGQVEVGPRPMYPYGHDEYWYGHDADVERWGNLLEVPYCRLGWYATVQTNINKPSIGRPSFNSGDLLAGTFPGNPVTLGASDLNWNVSPRLEVGYRYEHGLSEFRVGYQYFNANGSQGLAGFDSSGTGSLRTVVNYNIVDIDMLCTKDLNAESLPFVPPMVKSGGRAGLGRPLTPNWLIPPLEINWTWGIRLASTFYESTGNGDLRHERVANTFNGVGLHYAMQLNQRLSRRYPVFMHFRAEGSGMYGYLYQTYERVDFLSATGAAGNYRADGIGVPTVNVEWGLNLVPHWPERDFRLTGAWVYEEWFSFANSKSANANLIMHGLMLRGEFKF